MAAALSKARRATIWAVAQRVLSGVEPDRETLLSDCERTLGRRPARLRLGLRLFLWLLRWLPLLTDGGCFESLGAQRQDRLLRSLQAHRFGSVRAGFWGLRTMILVAHYGCPESHAAVAYAPAEDGNEALRKARA